MIQTKKAKEKLDEIKRSKKVYGIPKLPQDIDAMYENVCRGNLTPYYLDPDPVREDLVFNKLEKLLPKYTWDYSGSEKVAENFRHDMRARQMDEKTYNHIKKIPLWLLKLEFAIKYEYNRDLRRDINIKDRYIWNNPYKECLD